MKYLHIVAFVLLVIGGLNWGLVAFDVNVVNSLLGSWPILEAILYVLVGLSAIYLAATHKKDCHSCSRSGAAV